MAIAATAVSVETTASVTLTVTGLPVGYLLRVRRVSATGARSMVRGTSGLLDGTVLIASATMLIEDYEAPLLAPVSYLVEALPNPSGTLQSYQTDVVTIPHADADVVWLKDPGAPQRNVAVMVSTPPTWARPIEQAVHRVAGRRNAVILSGVRSGREGDLVVWTRSDEERETLDWLISPGSTLLWQSAPGMGVEDMYVAVGQSSEGRTAPDARDVWREWSLPLIEQDMPTTIGVGGSAGRTWQNILTENATWKVLRDKYATWEDVLLNRPEV
ncbi:hypothetical protein EES45_22890 [Streptomyces sp. ADI97-07]|uniref:hypothetical protein n=1 Tax=Streptomyces sp. ADI97-07 TaxID=1522762 RepID=UPI000F559736|nr:hypothetical protein [Streptomyces sp. ADI97-07]RPK76609.1 hypothetical protein EES45_22890 [Streptomyces sp. ADI97-07]